MKLVRIVLLLSVLSVISSACSMMGPRATITEEKRIIKTYPFSDPDPVPILARRNAGIYPYFRFDGFAREGRDQEWKVVRLENDFIQVYVLPEAGGKIWGAIEKSTGKDFIYHNEVMKFRDVAMRGPWTSGGIEFNFGLIGHTPSTATPVDYLLQENTDGSVSCFVGGIDLPGRTQWRVEICLPRDAAEFETTSFWYNPTPLQQSYYHWMNAAVHARDDLQFYYPGEYYIGHGGDAHPWPVNENGIDLSLYKNHYFGSHKSLHVLGSYADFSGGYWHGLDFGFGHWSRYDDMPGRKIWIWSLSRSGAIWEDLLTDRNGQYVEVQAGRQFSQAAQSSGNDSPFTQAAFLPYAADTWKEVWFPVKQIGGIVAANPNVALNVSRKGEKTRVAVNALKPIHDDLVVVAGNATVLKERLALAPMQVFDREIAVPAAEQDIKVLLGNQLIWRSDSGRGTGFSRPVVSPPEKAATTAEKAFLLGRQQELLRDYGKALEYYRDCVERDALHVPALVRLAELYSRRAEYEQALVWAKKALAIDTYHAGANFVAGAILKKLGNPASAREALGWAARSPEYRSAAYSLIAETHLMQSRFEDAAEYARRALDFNRANISALSALALAERKLNRQEFARRAQREIMSLDPLNHLAAAEACFLNGSQRNWNQLTSLIKSELPHETYLELAIYYAGLGMKAEAVQVLHLAPAHPLVDYWLAYLAKDESPAQGKALLAKAIQESPRLVFPFREETIPVLQWGLSQQRDWKTLYYLALIYWSKGRLEEAAGLLQECEARPDYGPFYLTRAELLRKTMPKAPAEDYKKALDLAPDDWRPWLALARLYSGSSSFQEALDLAQRGYEKFPGNFVLGMEYARALIDSARYQEALDVLTPMVVLPYEGASEGRVLFEKAHLLLAGENVRSGKYEEALAHIAKSKEWPENLGVGKPYDPDERLQDFMENLCNTRMGKGAKTLDRGALEKLRADLLKSRSWKSDLLTTLFRTGN
jgi:tetratricopeptide (TPR) repeat protein